MNPDHEKVVRYYQRWESRLVFDWLLWGAKHFGYYPNARADISERQAQGLMQDLVAQNLGLQPGQAILDAGCGQGVVSTYLAKKYRCHIDGVTIVPFEIPRAQRLAQKTGVTDRVKYHLMDYSQTNFPNDSFDGIYTMETLSHSPDVRKTLNEFWRILKPGGKIALFEYTTAEDDRFTPRERSAMQMIIEGSAMLGLKDIRHDRFPQTMSGVGFVNAREQNISSQVLPSLHRLYQIFRYPYALVKILKLKKFFLNTCMAVELYPLVEKGLGRYCIFTAVKPQTVV